MLIGKRKQKILMIIGLIIMAFIIYRIYQKNRTIEVYQVYPSRYAVKNFHFGKNQFKQLDTIAKRILLDSLRKGYISKYNKEEDLIFIMYDDKYFCPNMMYKDSSYYPTGFMEIPPDWYSYPEDNQIAIYEWDFRTGKNISKAYYQESFFSFFHQSFFFHNKICLSISDTTLNIDKSILPYYKHK